MKSALNSNRGWQRKRVPRAKTPAPVQQRSQRLPVLWCPRRDRRDHRIRPQMAPAANRDLPSLIREYERVWRRCQGLTDAIGILDDTSDGLRGAMSDPSSDGNVVIATAQVIFERGLAEAKARAVAELLQSRWEGSTT